MNDVRVNFSCSPNYNRKWEEFGESHEILEKLHFNSNFSELKSYVCNDKRCMLYGEQSKLGQRYICSTRSLRTLLIFLCCAPLFFPSLSQCRILWIGYTPRCIFTLYNMWSKWRLIQFHPNDTLSNFYHFISQCHFSVDRIIAINSVRYAQRYHLIRQFNKKPQNVT